MSSAATPQKDATVTPATSPALTNEPVPDDVQMVEEEARPPQQESSTKEQEDEPMEDADDVAMGLPLSKIKKIFKMDPEYTSASQSAVFATGCATELFVQYFVEHASMMAKMEKRKKIQYKDMSSVVADQDVLHFLSDTVPKTQILGDAIKGRKINMLEEDQAKHAELLGPDESAVSETIEEKSPQKAAKPLPKGQQTLGFEPVKKSPVKKAGITDLMSTDSDRNNDAMNVDN